MKHYVPGMAFEVGEKVGSYRIVRLLGQGGMGDVYEVEHVELGTHYALKAFACDYEEAEMLRRKFLDEGRSLARLEHPNVVRVFDLAVEPETGMPYFVMDLVLYEDGEAHTVEDVERADIDENLVYFWFKDAAAALDYIHEQGVVHCDVKPGNMLLGKDLHLKLTDFGISRIFGDRLRRDVNAMPTMVTKTGLGKTVLGTEHYMAPEVARGETPTIAADAYALGMMCFRLLTGVWYEEGSEALALLAKFKLRWMAVLPQLLSPHAERRPQKLYPLKEQLKEPPVTEPRQKAEPKKRKSRTNLIAALLGTTIAAAICAALYFGGRFAYEQFNELKAQNARQVAELQRQMREQAEADRKAEAERLAAEEKRRAEGQAKAKKSEAPVLVETPQEDLSKKLDDLLAEDEKKDEPKPEEPKTQTAVAAPRPVDYGPIPNVRYLWHDKRDASKPLQVRFLLANGANMDLMPMKKGSFFMSNCVRDGKGYHKVTFTYDFWMSKHLITAEQWRDFASFDCEDCRPIEKLVPTNYPVCKAFPFHSITSYCHYLTQRYRSQLPEGYEFRLPTEAELEYSEGGLEVADTRDWRRRGGPIAPQTFDRIRKSCSLNSHYKWDDSGRTTDFSKYIGCCARQFPSGVYDLWEECLPVLDRFKKDGGTSGFVQHIMYAEDETDPIRLDPQGSQACRQWDGRARYTGIGSHTEIGGGPCNWNGLKVAHIVIAPYVNRLAVYPQSNHEIEAKKIPDRKYDWSVPHKLSHPKELKFKLANGAEMPFCACPAGRFVMSNVKGQAKSNHDVTITRPFWMTKYLVTAQQWRDFGKYDCEGICRKVEKAFAKYPVSHAFKYRQWTAFCDYLTRTYGSQLQKGYVFRLPTEAEWEYAFTGGNGFSQMKKNPFWGSASGAGDGRFMDIVRNLQKKEKWLKELDWTDGNNESRIANRRIYIGGWSAPHEWGFYDLSTWSPHVVLDTLMPLTKDWYDDPLQALKYEDCEVDPLRWAGEERNLRCVFRNANDNRGVRADDNAFAHIVVGPDLVSEKQAAQGDKGFEVKPPVENKKPIKIGKVILEKGRQWTFELPAGEKLEFVKCPAGSFTMGYKKEEFQFQGADANTPHKVMITRPFWMSQYLLTAGQWVSVMEGADADGANGGDWKRIPRTWIKDDDAVAFFKLLNDKFKAFLPDGYVFRLPSEAEWEYALKANNKSSKNPYTKYRPSKEEVGMISVQQGIHDPDNFPVGTKMPNPWGLYDMIGLRAEPMLDTIPSKDLSVVMKGEWGWIQRLIYPKDTSDPLFVFDGAGSERIFRGKAPAGEGNKSSGGGYPSIRLCIGPDLLKEKGIKFKPGK